MIIISLNTILSVISITYRLLLCLIWLATVERLQQRLKPYKLADNNEIETKAIIAGTVVIFAGLIFEEGAEGNYSGFDSFGLFVWMIYNSIFMIQWTYLFLSSLNIKNESFKKVIEIYGILICYKRSDISKDADINEKAE